VHEAGSEELDEAPTVPKSRPDLGTVDPPITLDIPDDKKGHMSVRSAIFEAEVLIPRRIKILPTNRNIRDPFKHFGTAPPSREGIVDYNTLEGIEASQVWLSLGHATIEEILEEYEAMNAKTTPEAEYASFAMEMFFKRQRRFREIPSDRKWRTRRVQQLFCPPNDVFWFAPLPFETVRYDFKFDVRPDCSYWLYLAGFNRSYHAELATAVHVYQNEIACPYLTIEFKKQGQSIVQVRVQAAAAASVALYSRFLLKKTALAVTETPWSDSDKSQMRHYVITLVGSAFLIWILEANFGEDGESWNGCHMTLLWQANCLSESVAIQLERWINEIHRWGLSKHATGCQQDVKEILRDYGVDVREGTAPPHR